jgi:Ssp1 endopeptidase immunity protein Rap1a
MRCLGFIVAAFLFASSPVLATDDSTATSLVQSYCEKTISSIGTSVQIEPQGNYRILPGNGGLEAAHCTGFVRAMVSATSLIPSPRVCFPQDVPMLTLVRVVVAYGYRHPEKITGTPALFVINAFAEAYPCR